MRESWRPSRTSVPVGLEITSMPRRSETDSTARLNNAANAETAITARTRTPVTPTSTKSTSFAWAAGRRRSTLRADSRPTRMAAIIPDAPQKRAIRNRSPSADSGEAICSIELRTSCSPAVETGRTSRSSSITVVRSSSFWRTRPKIETSRIVSGKSEKSTLKPIAAAYCGQRSRKRSSNAYARSTT